jgi:hypothetical protein
MKRGELIIAWLGGLASVFVVSNFRVGRGIRTGPVLGDLGEGIAHIFFYLLAIWIVCGLVWLTIYRRK